MLLLDMPGASERRLHVKSLHRFFCTKPRHVKLCPGHGAQHFASRYWYNFESWRDVSPAYLEKHSLELEDIQERMDFVGSGHHEAKGMEFLWLGMLVVVICCDYL